uniref:chromosome partitioning protein ParB n=1 Tax=Psychrobacter sp. TaxID=56811 RepID=UPI001598E74D|nr:chromosome partitioning protein ParB [Psychrobacter sp.]QJS05178.1 partitioning protein ParB [Psychrobacter sp.]QJS05355.1 partitioning protein ParB [Psychrobacter sp.]QJS05436.1 partitioning protein ParB [Psychrobacter sp.]QJS05837.1 partitioning protein ParB [Psychrobacter sp.]
MKAGRPSKDAKHTLDLSDVTDSPKKTVRVNFNLDENKYIELKKYALENRKTVTQLLTEMIEKRLVER